jgi:hypothetical protein
VDTAVRTAQAKGASSPTRTKERVPDDQEIKRAGRLVLMVVMAEIMASVWVEVQMLMFLTVIVVVPQQVRRMFFFYP